MPSTMMGAGPYEGAAKPPQAQTHTPQPTTPQQAPQQLHAHVPGLGPMMTGAQQHPHPHSQSQPQQQQQRSVKRPRPVKSCTECRKRKLRCDRLLPCSQCQKSNRSCKYATDPDGGYDSDDQEIETTEAPRPTKRNYPPGAALTPTATVPEIPPSAPTAKNGDAGGLPMLEELSLRMERLEKQVMVVRSPAATDVSGGKVSAAPADTIRRITVKDNCRRTRYFGQISPRVMMNLV